jgi:biopolymer transport protein ExbD
MRFTEKEVRTSKPEVNFASMIDVMFVLLSFFIFTTGSSSNESRLSPNLKVQYGTDAKEDLDPQVIDVSREDGVVVFRVGASVFTTRETLKAAIEPLPREQGLFVRVHGGVDVGSAAMAIQTARDVGFEAVTYVPAK